jgi:phosphoribosylformimino-5-aminoimidazole carboxamide ribotide isomerase
VIITSYLFPEGKFSEEHLKLVLSALGGDKGKLVIDLSCRRKGDKWFVATNKWQTITDTEVNRGKQNVKKVPPTQNKASNMTA